MTELQILQVRLQMEQLITDREMMLAENAHRAMQGYSQAYGEAAFAELSEKFAGLYASVAP